MEEKSKYHVLAQDLSEDDDAMLFGQNKILKSLAFKFDEGIEFPEEGIEFPLEYDIDLYADRGRMTDSLFIDFLGTVFSERTQSLLLSLNVTHIQYLKLNLVDKFSNIEEVEIAKYQDKELEYKTMIYGDYSIANIRSVLDCVNHDKSDVEYYVHRPETPEDLPEDMKAMLLEQEVDNEIDFIRKLVLDESKIPEDIHIFRLKDCPRILVFKESIVQAIREAKLTGFVFVPLSEYTDEIPDDDDDEKEENNKEPELQEAAATKEQEPTTKRKGIVIKKIKRKQP